MGIVFEFDNASRLSSEFMYMYLAVERSPLGTNEGGGGESVRVGCIFGGFRKELTPAHGGLHPYSCGPNDGLRSSNLWRLQYLAMVLESWCDFKSHLPPPTFLNNYLLRCPLSNSPTGQSVQLFSFHILPNWQCHIISVPYKIHVYFGRTLVLKENIT